MLKNKELGLVSALACAVLISACQPIEKEKEKSEPDQTTISEPVVEVLRLTGNMQKVPVVIEPCKGNGCPEISIDRLETNHPELDRIIDQAIAEHLASTIELDDNSSQKDTSQNAVSEVNSASAASEPKSQKTAAQQLAEQIQPYINNFLKLDDELKKLGVNHQITLSISPKILNSQAPLSTVVINSSHYLGGAHGSSAQHYYNYDLNTKKIVELDQLLVPNQKAKLDQLAYEQFKIWVLDNKLAERVQDYEQAWKFSLSKNFYLGKHGLILQYQEYEIGPYVVGLPRLTIPYEQLQGILKAEYFPEDFKAKQSSSEAVVTEASTPKSSTTEVKKP